MQQLPPPLTQPYPYPYPHLQQQQPPQQQPPPTRQYRHMQQLPPPLTQSYPQQLPLQMPPHLMQQYFQHMQQNQQRLQMPPPIPPYAPFPQSNYTPSPTWNLPSRIPIAFPPAPGRGLLPTPGTMESYTHPLVQNIPFTPSSIPQSNYPQQTPPIAETVPEQVEKPPLHPKLSTDCTGGASDRIFGTTRTLTDTLGFAGDLSRNELIPAAEEHLQKKIQYFQDLCKHCNEEDFKSICKNIVERGADNIKAKHYFFPQGYQPKSGFEGAHISIIPRFTIIHTDKLQYEYTDERLYQQLNAVDYADATINRVDDEIEKRGRLLAIQLINRVIKNDLNEDSAVALFKDHIKTVLQNISGGTFRTNNYKNDQREQAKNIANGLLASPLFQAPPTQTTTTTTTTTTADSTPSANLPESESSPPAPVESEVQLKEKEEKGKEM